MHWQKSLGWDGHTNWILYLEPASVIIGHVRYIGRRTWRWDWGLDIDRQGSGTARSPFTARRLVQEAVNAC